MSRSVCRVGSMWSAACRAGAGGLLLVTASALLPAAHAASGLTVLTHATNDTIAADTIVVRLEGVIAPPMARDFADIWSRRGPGHARLLIDLDSPGGDLDETEALVKVIAAIRQTARVNTLVRHDAKCASGCIAIFVQGAKRHAGGSSTWLFHGACRSGSNIPSLAQTGRFLDILRDADVAPDFVHLLVTQGYVTTPGKFWVSGHALVHVFHANIITDLLEPWRPEPPRGPPVGQTIRSF